MATHVHDPRLGEAIFEQLDTPGMVKKALDAVNDYTRTTMREEGIYRRILPAVTITNDDIDRQVGTDNPAKIVDKEPGSPAAMSVPFGTLPNNCYIRGPRYLVTFDRIVSPRFVKDVEQLRTWKMDIRQVMSDNAIKDMLAEEDSKFIAAINRALVGADQVVPSSGVIQWETLEGGIDRENLAEALKIMPKTGSHLEVKTCLVNNVTIKELIKFGRDEMGGDASQDVIMNGWTKSTFLGCEWLASIKRDLIPDDVMFMFADPKFIGKSFLLEDTTMYVEKRAFMIEFFCYESAGGSLGHLGGLAKATFA